MKLSEAIDEMRSAMCAKDLSDNYLKKKDGRIFFRLRYGLLGNSMNLPGKGGRRISVEGYKICQRFFKFN